MSEEIPGWHWSWSCRINRALGGSKGQPLCARAWQRGWQWFIDAMQVAFRDPTHCEAIFIRWLALQSYDPPVITGRTGSRPGH